MEGHHLLISLWNILFMIETSTLFKIKSSLGNGRIILRKTEFYDPQKFLPKYDEGWKNIERFLKGLSNNAWTGYERKTELSNLLT